MLHPQVTFFDGVLNNSYSYGFILSFLASLEATLLPTSSIMATPTQFVSSTSSLQPSITMVETPTPSANSSESGLSNKNKAIIGGVVGGIGGAVLLGALGFFLFRRWRRNRRANDRESFHPQADDTHSVNSPEMSGTRGISGEYSYYNSATNLSKDPIIHSQPGRY